MRKINFSILLILAFLTFTPSVFAFNAVVLEEDIKEALIKRNLVRAAKMADIWRQEADDAPVPHFLLAYSYYVKGDYQKVPGLLSAVDTDDKKKSLLSWAEQFSREYPQDPIPYLLKGDACIRLKKYEQAMKEFDLAQKIAPDLFLVYAARGMFFAFQNDYDLAIENFNQAISLRPGYADIFNSRGIIHYCRGDYPAALNDFNQAINISPGFALAYLGRSKVYRCLKRDDLAAADLKKADEIDKQGFALSSKSVKDPLTGKLMRQFSFNLETSPSKLEVKVPFLKKSLIDGAFGSLKGVDSTPDGEIVMIKNGERSEKILDNQFVFPALSFLLYNDQFFFETEEAGRN
ncbi:MAG: tetratricopeptide repeat protein [Candidatus Omnitrophica bacterium]|nr:tetratricopeptide repeat protein [Candidatus Omnitrophota bacterium]